ncbi:hypothetical protein PSHT_08542 [Puccinia striiformis]|uniref:Uncharacterized protein n=1 Tax=Puccinia striiformis TaxID=27350 RepID=A0A2S4VP35_9BASI|nr:hypothetical protein PSHT_08542 [Puccinia striiformis]
MNTILSCLITFGLLSMAQAGTTSVPLDNVHPTSYEFTIDSAHPQGVFAIKTDTASGILNCNTCKDFYTAKGCVKLTSRKGTREPRKPAPRVTFLWPANKAASVGHHLFLSLTTHQHMPYALLCFVFPADFA